MKNENLLGGFLEQNQLHPPEIIQHQIKILRIDSGKAILQKGEELRSVYIILSGSVDIEEPVYTGSIYSFTALGTGSLIGELEVLLGRNLTQFTVRARTDAVLLKLSRDAFNQWWQQDIQMSNMIVRTLAQKMMSNAILTSTYPFTSGLVKVANFLAGYCQERVLDEESFPIHVSLTRSAMGDKLGISVRTVNRSIKRLAEHALLSVEKKVIVIGEAEYRGLENFSEEF